MTWTQWTERLRDHFFQPANAGREVRLRVTNDFLDSVMPDLGGSPGFRQVLQLPPVNFVSDVPLIERGLRLHRVWRVNRVECPVFLPYLCMLCLAWDEEYDGNASNYYDRLAQIYPDHNLGDIYDGETALAHWVVLWWGLRDWANTQMEGQFGTFNPAYLGHKQHVGKPLYQMILTSHHAEGLPELFYRSGVGPADADAADGGPLPAFMGNIVDWVENHSSWAKQLVGTRVADILGGGVGDNNLPQLQALAPILAEHLREWDGTRPIALVGAGRSGGMAGGGRPADGPVTTIRVLRLGLMYDDANALLRPVLCLNADCLDEQWSVAAVAGGASSPFVPIDSLFGRTGSGFQVPAAWWTMNANVPLMQNGAPVSGLIPEKGVRLFQWVPDGSMLLECHQMPPARHVLAVAAVNDPKVGPNWPVFLRAVSLEGVAVQPVRMNGLPTGWQGHWLSNVENITPQTLGTLPDGQAPSRTRPRMMRFEGGSKSSPSSYFPFDLPMLVVQSPPRYTVEFPDGVQHNPPGSVHPEAPVYHELADAPAGLHTFILRKPNGVEAERINLRVAMPAGQSIFQNYSMDELGRITGPGVGAHGVSLNNAAGGGN